MAILKEKDNRDVYVETDNGFLKVIDVNVGNIGIILETEKVK